LGAPIWRSQREAAELRESKWIGLDRERCAAPILLHFAFADKQGSRIL